MQYFSKKSIRIFPITSFKLNQRLVVLKFGCPTLQKKVWELSEVNIKPGSEATPCLDIHVKVMTLYNIIYKIFNIKNCRNIFSYLHWFEFEFFLLQICIAIVFRTYKLHRTNSTIQFIYFSSSDIIIYIILQLILIYVFICLQLKLIYLFYLQMILIYLFYLQLILIYLFVCSW